MKRQAKLFSFVSTVAATALFSTAAPWVPPEWPRPQPRLPPAKPMPPQKRLQPLRPAVAAATAIHCPAPLLRRLRHPGLRQDRQDNLSTFAVDVDTGAYTVARAYIEEGYLPPADSVRAEEFINYFDYGYPNPKRAETFAINLAGGPSPFTERASGRMLQVGIQGYSVPADERQDVVLTFVIDVSGSMDMENRLHLAKRALHLLVDELRPTDEVAVVVYGSNARIVLPMTEVADSDEIHAAIDSVWPEDSTNAEAGLRLGYKHAAKYFNPDAINRVVLVSDGVANVGTTDAGGILDEIEKYADKGIYLTTVGMGMGNYNDTLMEQLADKGDGSYAYVDDMTEARRIFVHELTGTLLTIAKDAKIQVEFNAEVVERYRLVGYENRDVADDDFRNDEVDAGEIGSGHSVTALYEVELFEEADDLDATLATVHMRWQDPESSEIIEIERSLTVGELATSFEEMAPRFQLAQAVAEFAEILKDTPFAEGSTLADLYQTVDEVEEAIETDEGATDHNVAELKDLIWQAADMEQAD